MNLHALLVTSQRGTIASMNGFVRGIAMVWLYALAIALPAGFVGHLAKQAGLVGYPGAMAIGFSILVGVLILAILIARRPTS